MFQTKKLVMLSLLIALQVILTRQLGITTPFVRISFAFVAIAVNGALFGPLAAGVSGVIADLIGATLFPSGTFFPGFTLSAFLVGFLYGLFLHKEEISFKDIVIACVSTSILGLFLNSLWLVMMMGEPYSVVLARRIVPTLILLVVQIIVLQLILQRIKNESRRFVKAS